ncbi:MAG: hypothetical protein WDM84_08350 [Bauldia sp.]
MRVFVTGAAGFIGSVVTKELIAGAIRRRPRTFGCERGRPPRRGAEVLRGSLEDLDSLRRGARTPTV